MVDWLIWHSLIVILISSTSFALGFYSCLFLKGKEAKIPAGTILPATISETREIKVNPNKKVIINPATNNVNVTNTMNKTDKISIESSSKPKPDKSAPDG